MTSAEASELTTPIYAFGGAGQTGKKIKSRKEKNMKHTYNSCTITGRAAEQLPYGMDEGHPDCIALKIALTNKIAELHTMGVTEFYSNAEYGVSFFGAEAVIALRGSLNINLNICMPFERQADRYSREVRERFFELHELSDTVEILSARFYENCYHETDMHMVDRSDIIIADNLESFIISYAAKNQKRIELLDNLPLEIL